MHTLNLQSPAKLNLMLHVTHRLPNGYHHLHSLFALTQKGHGLWDDITLSLSDHFSFRYTTEPYIIPDASFQNLNVISKTWAWCIQKNYPVSPVHIHLHKRLPLASGLGSGSSNMASVLYGLGVLSKFSEDQFNALEVASGELGSDVRICLQHKRRQGGWFWVDGTGSEGGRSLEKSQNPLNVLILMPNIGLSTQEVYQIYTSRQYPFQHPIYPPNVVDLDWLRESSNALFEPAQYLYPRLEKIFQSIKTTKECLLTRMSGSGPSIFALYPHLKAAQDARIFLQSLYPDFLIWLTKI